MTKITAIIPTLNEEGRIEKALQSVAFADEIIVIDSFSTDATVALVQQSRAILIQRTFDNFSAQKNFAIVQASNDWIFILDADEFIPEALHHEIHQLDLAHTPHVGFLIYRTFYFKETPIHFAGWQRDRVLRLFNRNFCAYEGLVHENIEAKGSVGTLQHKIQHFSYVSTHRYLEKLKLYAELQAKDLVAKKSFVTPYHVYIKPFIRLVIQFIIKLGFLDGKRGFTISYLHAKGVYYRYKAYYALQRTLTLKTRNFNADLPKKDKVLSIIIVNYKSWKVLAPCLQSLQFPSNTLALDIIVVDNQSNDGVLPTFAKQFPSVNFIENTGNNGFANACNLGASHASGETLLFLNPDTVVTREAIEGLWNHLQQHTALGMVSCKQKNTNGSYEKIERHFPKASTLFGFFRIFSGINHSTLKDDVYYPDWVSGSLMMLTWKTFVQVGGFNEAYWMYFEDVDLCKRVQESAGKIALLNSYEIEHHHGGASRINFSTASLTKAEVLISKYQYLYTHFQGLHRGFLMSLLVVQTLVSSLLFSILALPLVFIRKARLQWYIAIRLLTYYSHVISNRTWMSPRAIAALKVSATDKV